MKSAVLVILIWMPANGGQIVEYNYPQYTWKACNTALAGIKLDTWRTDFSAFCAAKGSQKGVIAKSMPFRKGLKK